MRHVTCIQSNVFFVPHNNRAWVSVLLYHDKPLIGFSSEFTNFDRHAVDDRVLTKRGNSMEYFLSKLLDLNDSERRRGR